MTEPNQLPQAEMSLEKVLRPAWNFEIDYHGKTGARPIFFTYPTVPPDRRPPWPAPDYASVVDGEALSATPPTGLSPMLAKFASVPMGATMLFFIPFVPRPSGVTMDWVYVWRVVWRNRSAGDYVRRPDIGRGYQVPAIRFGAADSRSLLVPGRPTMTLAGNRYVLPAVSEAQLFQRPEPDFSDTITPPYPCLLLCDGAEMTNDTRALPNSPFYPGAGSLATDTYAVDLEYQQGVFDPNFPNISGETETFKPVGATHFAKFIKALGGEFAVECFKFEYEVPGDIRTYRPRDWEFLNVGGSLSQDAEDFGFSAMFGVGATVVDKEPPQDTGVRAYFGTAPE